MDDQTMRIVLGGVTLTVLLLFYWGVYRPTRSSFSGWWTLALVCAASARGLLLLDGSRVDVLTGALSVVAAVVGVTCVWFATRSLRREHLPLWLLGAAPAVVLVAASLGNAAGGVWSGNGPVFIYMASMFVAGSVETWLAWRERRASTEVTPHGEPVVALLVTAVAGTVLAAYYALRAITQVVIGMGNEGLRLAAGSGSESVIQLVCLVAVTFSVSAVGWDQQTTLLHRRAMQDDLTGLLGRSEFRLRAERAFEEARANGAEVLLVVADLDHFKRVNDVHGHTAGDGALVAFANVLGAAMRHGEIAGRLGGEEFGAVLLGSDAAVTSARLSAISADYSTHSRDVGFDLPTVSYGIAGSDDGDSFAEVYERADLALYSAKADGRDRAVRYSADSPRRPGRVPRTPTGTVAGAAEVAGIAAVAPLAEPGISDVT